MNTSPFTVRVTARGVGPFDYGTPSWSDAFVLFSLLQDCASVNSVEIRDAGRSVRSWWAPKREQGEEHK